MLMRRRRFLEGCGHGLAGLLAAAGGSSGVAAAGAAGREIAADVVIVGGGLGGCAAALAGIAGRAHRRPDRADRLDRRPAHVAGRAARRAPLDRAVRRECVLPGAEAGDPRLLPPPLPDDRRSAGKPDASTPATAASRSSATSHGPRWRL